MIERAGLDALFCKLDVKVEKEAESSPFDPDRKLWDKNCCCARLGYKQRDDSSSKLDTGKFILGVMLTKMDTLRLGVILHLILLDLAAVVVVGLL